jgi:hypothetical protein
MRSWEIVIPDLSSVHDMQHELLNKGISDQEQIIGIWQCEDTFLADTGWGAPAVSAN